MSRVQSFRDECGEGVISAAIVVLVMAVLGGAMYLVFSETFGNAADRIGDEIDSIVDGPA